LFLPGRVSRRGLLFEELTHREDEAVMLRDVLDIEWKDDRVCFAAGRCFDLKRK